MYKLLLCLRYLRTRYIALASIISVMLGVATMIVVNSVMAGFSTEMRDRIHGLLADMMLESRSMDGMEDPDAIMAKITEAAGEYIAEMTPVVEVPGLITFNLAGEPYTRPVDIIGIDPKGKSLIGPMKEYLESFQPVMKDGKIVRPALRTMKQPPNWELTEEATKYRKQRLRNSRLLLQEDGFRVGHASPTPEVQPATGTKQAVAEQSSDAADSNVETVGGFGDEVYEESNEPQLSLIHI